MLNLEKRNRINAETIVIDGFWGCGKSLLYNLLPSLNNIIRAKYLPEYENIHILNNEKLISDDVAKWYLANLLDKSYYNSSIGRESNLRWSDDSGLKNSNNKIKDIMLLFSKDGEYALEKFKNNNHAQLIFTHNLSLSNNSLINLYSSNIFFIEIIRNPIFVISNYENFLMRFDSPKEFTPSFYINQKKFPWFTSSYKESLENLSDIEIAILIIINSYKKYFQEREKYFKLKNYLEVCFEELIFNTDKVVEDIESSLRKERNSKKLRKQYNKLKLPREHIIKGLKSGTEKLNNKSNQTLFQNDSDYCEYHLNYIKNKIPNLLYKEFIEVVNKFQNLYPFFRYKI